jgi:hypothetical protein
MNIDTQFQHALLIAPPTRSVHDQPDQASARPVERPHHDEAADNHTGQHSAQAKLQRDPHHAPRQEQSHQTSERPAEPQHGLPDSTAVGELLDVMV